MFTDQGLLPVLNQNPTKISAQSLPNGALPAVPMVTGCRTQGQIAVTYVRIQRNSCFEGNIWRRTFQFKLMDKFCPFL